MKNKFFGVVLAFIFSGLKMQAQWTLSNVTTYSAQIQWEAQAGVSGYLVVRSGDGNIEFPSDPAGYQKGDYIGADQVAYVGSANSFTQKNLRASSHYEFMVFPYFLNNGVYNFIEVPFPNLLLDTPYNMMGDYYVDVDSTQAGFIADLQERVRNPYIKIAYNSYDETMIANYAAVDTANGQSVVECVYSEFHYVYTPPFDWLPISREHTYCHSWMPSYSSTSTDEYADQHHLFPTQQNNANGVRSNHPLGEVETVQSSFLQGKLGLNEDNQVVYEPRDEQKGDAARALLYMSLRYDGLDGLDWTFDRLNTITLPNLSEAPQSLALLLQWHFQDLPDAFERGRNDYIQSIQQNRNPFIDHPYWVNYIRFEDLTYIEPVVIQDNFRSQWLLLNNGKNPTLVGDGINLIVCCEWFNLTGEKVSSRGMQNEVSLHNESLASGLFYARLTLKDGSSVVLPWWVNKD